MYFKTQYYNLLISMIISSIKHVVCLMNYKIITANSNNYKDIKSKLKSQASVAHYYNIQSMGVQNMLCNNQYACRDRHNLVHQIDHETAADL